MIVKSDEIMNTLQSRREIQELKHAAIFQSIVPKPYISEKKGWHKINYLDYR